MNPLIVTSVPTLMSLFDHPARSSVRGAHLESPRDHLAVSALGVDEDPRVRVGPLQLGDRSGHLDRLGLIELRGERVMGEQGVRTRRQ